MKVFKETKIVYFFSNIRERSAHYTSFSEVEYWKMKYIQGLYASYCVIQEWIAPDKTMRFLIDRINYGSYESDAIMDENRCILIDLDYVSLDELRTQLWEIKRNLPVDAFLSLISRTSLMWRDGDYFDKDSITVQPLENLGEWYYSRALLKIEEEKDKKWKEREEKRKERDEHDDE